jgi:general secretion pathway protein G
VNRIRKQDAGFTMVELLIVISIMLILMLIAVPKYTIAIKNAREAVLREDLHIMRAAIDSYTMDKQKAPQSLDDLVQEGYLKTIPEDPITRSKDTWQTDTSDMMSSVDQTDPGIVDVHSGAEESSTNGETYNSW